ncbi:MAG: hypothetical protein JST66_16825 [Bacteroidetes bacterium]|nr:hypothetical protein [Bacteroidota bacterium]
MHLTIRTLVFAFLFAHATTDLSAQQVPTITAAPRPGAELRGCDVQNTDLVREGAAYRVWSCRQDGGFHLDVFDIATGTRTFTKELTCPARKEDKPAFESACFLDGQLWVLFVTLDRAKGEGVYDLQAWPVDPSTGRSEGGPKRIGEITFRASGTGIHEASRLGVKVGTSPDGKRAAVLFDKLRDKDYNLLLSAWVLKGEMEVEWKAVYAIPQQDAPRLDEALIDDRGNVYALFASFLRMKLEGGRMQGGNILLLGPEHFAPLPPLPGLGKNAMAWTADGGLLLAGVRSTEGATFERNVRSVIIRRFDADLRPLGEPIEAAVEDGPSFFGLASLVVHPRPDGGAYVVARPQDGTPLTTGFVVASFDKDLHPEWTRWFTEQYADYSAWPAMHSAVDGTDLVLLVPTSPKNLEAWKNGEKKAKTTKPGDIISVRMRFTEAGTPTFDVDPDHRVDRAMGDPGQRGPVRLCDCEVRENGKMQERTCIVRFP